MTVALPGAAEVRLLLCESGVRPVDSLDLAVLDAAAVQAGAVGLVMVARANDEVGYHISAAAAVLLRAELERPSAAWVALLAGPLGVHLADCLGPQWQEEIELGLEQLLADRAEAVRPLLAADPLVLTACGSADEATIARAWVCSPGPLL